MYVGDEMKCDAVIDHHFHFRAPQAIDRLVLTCSCEVAMRPHTENSKRSVPQTEAAGGRLVDPSKTARHLRRILLL